MATPNYNYGDSVFINCPFDDEYKALFETVIFTVFDCGFFPRCTLEDEDASQIRITKIYNIINSCKYGIHDISRTELSEGHKLPRFNMPLELGIFLGAKKFGNRSQNAKSCLIMDKEQYRFQKFISDIAGQDIKAHGNESKNLLRIVRNWLSSSSGRITIPGANTIWNRYQKFISDLPDLCLALQWDLDDLTFNDYTLLITEWLTDD